VCERFDGELSQRPGQAFAFVIANGGERIFVHPNEAAKLRGLTGERVSCRAVTGKDKQGKPGWRAVSVDLVNRADAGMSQTGSINGDQIRQAREM
jgi:hypothetical protein